LDKFISITPEDKRAYFEATAAKLSLRPEFIEKDFWVCWMLKTLFSLNGVGQHLIFKGGTSLSKCYKVIKRFSEDIDISISKEFLLGEDAIFPDSRESNKENNRRIERLKDECKSKINNVIVPNLKENVLEIIGSNGWKIEVSPDDQDGQTVIFFFPQTLKTVTGGYVQQSVKIEFGARSDHWPSKTLEIVPYIIEVFGETEMKGASVKVLAAERTFWEKVTILHAIYHRPIEKGVQPRMSRHYYDIYSMINSPICEKAISGIGLLKKVAEHKKLYFRDNKARYDEAVPPTLRLIPKEDQIKILKEDYKKMEEMIFEEPIPEFTDIIEKLRDLERTINNKP
jgi:predicted nucleotidyltransferase component of viral defense system